MNSLYREDFEQEPTEQWLGYLTDEQFETVDEVLEDIKSSQDFQLHFILGVAGTGKTQVLLSLARDLRDNQINVVHLMSTPLREYLTRSRVKFDGGRNEAGSVILLDDPLSHKAIFSKYKEAKESGARALVVAADPFQFQDRDSLIKFAVYLHPELNTELHRKTSLLLANPFQDVIYSEKPYVHWLKTIFRQQAKPGALALELSKRIFETNNPWNDKPRQVEWKNTISSQVDRALLDVEYASKGGEVEYVETKEPLEEIKRAILKHAQRADKWDRNHSFLVVCDPKLLALRPGEKYFNSLFQDSVEDEEETTLEDLKRYYNPESFQEGNEHDEQLGKKNIGPTLLQLVEWNGGIAINFNEPQKVRGVEYQEVIMHLPRSKFQGILTGEAGRGDTWELSLPVHTFLTRARDKVTIIDS